MRLLGKRMFKWLRRQRSATKPVTADAYRIVAKSGNQTEPPSDPDPIEKLVRIVGESHADDPRRGNDGLSNQRTPLALASSRVGSA
jgi:hypothetical protein